jgi:tRNA-binding EMAP/Myf-like protein
VTVTTHGVVVGRVVAVRDHPRGDRIWLADVDLGGGHVVQIVWGGKRIVRPNSLVPVAPPGSRLNGTKMRRRTYRGQASYGMLCSLAELGWDPAVADRVALLSTSARLLPGTRLDDYANEWKPILANRRLDWGLNVLTATRDAFSGGWRLGSRGGLERQRIG